MTSIRLNRRRIAIKLQTGGRPACAINRAGLPPIHNSRRATTDAAGRRMKGAVIAQSGALADANPWRFSSEYQDLDLGLVYYNYRHYDSVTGRWLSRDPIVELGGLGLYGWCANIKYGYDVLGLKKKNRTVCDKDHEFDTRAVILEGPYFSPGPYPPDDPQLNLAAAIAAIGAVVGAATSALEDIAANVTARVVAKVKGSEVDWPDANSAVQAIALINNFSTLVKIKGGYVSVWTKVKCQTCRCNKFLFFPLSTYSWQDDDSGEWVQCDIGKTPYGKINRGLLGDDGAFAMPSRDKLNEVRDQCRKQAEGHCDGN